MSFREVSALILDDNSHMRSLVRAVLKGLGVGESYEASDAATAFELIKSSQIDLAFVDYRLQDIDGVEFTRMIRTAPDSPDPHLPIIMVTAYSEKSRVLEAINAGIDEFLVKPIRANDVAKRIDAVVRNRRPFVRTDAFFGPDRRRRDDPKYTGPRRRHTDDQVVEM
ncbi:MAG: response regulator [Pseudomonadota bacterium]